MDDSPTDGVFTAVFSVFRLVSDWSVLNGCYPNSSILNYLCRAGGVCYVSQLETATV